MALARGGGGTRRAVVTHPGSQETNEHIAKGFAVARSLDTRNFSTSGVAFQGLRPHLWYLYFLKAAFLEKVSYTFWQVFHAGFLPRRFRT